jgi:TRAP-type C4-dicarboxylate transport system permease small subunit
LVRAEAWGRWAENTCLVLLLGGLVVLAVGQIVLRNLFSMGFPWVDGAIRLMVLWLAVIGAVAATRDRKHIAIDLVPRLLGERWRVPAAIAVNLFACVVCGYLTRYSWVFVRDAREFGDMLLGQWPAWILELVLPVGFALMCYRFALRALGAVLGRPSTGDFGPTA